MNLASRFAIMAVATRRDLFRSSPASWFHPHPGSDDARASTALRFGLWPFLSNQVTQCDPHIMTVKYHAWVVIVLFAVLLAGCEPDTAPTTNTATRSPAATSEPATPVPTAPPAMAAEATATAVPEASPTPQAPATTLATAATATAATSTSATALPTLAAPIIQEYPLPPGTHPHDVAPAPDGWVWYTGQHSGELGRLNPDTGETRQIPLGQGSAPHGVIVGPDGAPWVTDGGQNAIVRVDPLTQDVTLFPLPTGSSYANLNTATFDDRGVLWFTGQSGVYGRLDPAVGQVELFDAPRGRGPYGIATTPSGDVYYASLAGSYVGRIDRAGGSATVLEPPTPGQGARRVWADSLDRLWVSEWNAGKLAMYDPSQDAWQEWPLPGANPQPYAVWVDERDQIWLSDFGANAIVRFEPVSETFTVFTLPSSPANVRQILGRPGEVWGAESGVDQLVAIRTAVTGADDF